MGLPDLTQFARETRKILKDTATPYGDITAVDRDNRISISSDHPLSEQRDRLTAGVERLPEDSVIRLRANDSTESIETVDQLQYSPGYVGETGMAIQIPQEPTGDQEVRWGYWGGDDGVYWGWDATSPYVERIRNRTRQGKDRPGDWSGDTPARTVVEQLKRGAITRQQLALYNFGSVGHEIYDRDSGEELRNNTVHNSAPATGTTLSRQNNPLRVEVSNPAAEDFDVFLADRQATIRGQFTASNRSKGDFRTDVSLDGTTWVPIMTLRIKDDYDTIDIELLDLQIFVSDNILVQFRSGAGSTTDADYDTPQNIDAAETAMEVDRSPTASITDGFHRFQRGAPGGGQGNVPTPLGEFDTTDLGVKNDRPVTVFVRLVEGTGGTLSLMNLNWEETW